MSPRAWGCTAYAHQASANLRNVPTCVGVYRGSMRLRRNLSQCPHVRGGVPVYPGLNLHRPTMSPRAWGCTATSYYSGCAENNVPTCVGVYRHQ